MSELENWKQSIEESQKFLNEMKNKLFQFFDTYYIAKTVKLNSSTGGELICKKCGKKYRWKDWGRDMTRSFTMAKKHVHNKHGVSRVPVFVVNNNWVNEWFERRERS
jgi:hypothetical protein